MHGTEPRRPSTGSTQIQFPRKFMRLLVRVCGDRLNVLTGLKRFHLVSIVSPTVTVTLSVLSISQQVVKNKNVDLQQVAMALGGRLMNALSS